MDDAVPMRLVERVSDLHRELQRIGDVQWTGVQSPRERLALEIFQDEIIHRLSRIRERVPAQVVERADVRMVQLRNRFRFTLQSRPRLGVGGDVIRQNLDGDGAVQPGIARFVDFAHPAGPERRQDLVRTEP